MSGSVNHEKKKRNHVQTFITHHWHHILKNLLLPFGSALMAKDSFVCVYPGTPHQLHLFTFISFIWIPPPKKKIMPLLGRVLDWIIDLWILEFNPHNFLHHHNPHPPSPLPLLKKAIANIFFSDKCNICHCQVISLSADCCGSCLRLNQIKTVALAWSWRVSQDQGC